MTNEQFLALAKLMRMTSVSPSQAVARMVLVDGITTADAARTTGITRQAAGQAVKRARQGLELARTAAGSNTPAQRLTADGTD